MYISKYYTSLYYQTETNLIKNKITPVNLMAEEVCFYAVNLILYTLLQNAKFIEKGGR